MSLQLEFNPAYNKCTIYLEFKSIKLSYDIHLADIWCDTPKFYNVLGMLFLRHYMVPSSIAAVIFSKLNGSITSIIIFITILVHRRTNIELETRVEKPAKDRFGKWCWIGSSLRRWRAWAGQRGAQNGFGNRPETGWWTGKAVGLPYV